MREGLFTEHDNLQATTPPPEPPLEVVKHLFILKEDKNQVSKLQDLPLELSSSFQERCSESNLERSYIWITITAESTWQWISLELHNRNVSQRKWS